jgi:hypothetical protein
MGGFVGGHPASHLVIDKDPSVVLRWRREWRRMGGDGPAPQRG